MHSLGTRALSLVSLNNLSHVNEGKELPCSIRIKPVF